MHEGQMAATLPAPQLKITDLGAGIAFGALALLTLIIAGKTEYPAYAFHALVFAIASGWACFKVFDNATSRGPVAIPQEIDAKPNYNMGPVKFATIAAMFWGIAGFTVGLVIALQLAFPVFNFELALDQLRPAAPAAHLGGDLRLRRQRASRHIASMSCSAPAARAWRATIAPWFVIWGYNLFIVIAGTGYLLGITQGKEYAEPEWYADLWLTDCLGGLPARLSRHPLEAQGAAYLCGQLVLPRLHRHHRRAASGQQRTVPVSIFSAPRATSSGQACRMRCSSGGMATTRSAFS
jgi:hypothetical protein